MLEEVRHIVLAAFLGFAGVAAVFSVVLRLTENSTPDMIGMFRLGLFGMLATGTVLLGMILIHWVTDVCRVAPRMRG